MKSKTRFLKSNDAVSETIGYIYILGIVIISVSVMMVVSYPILSNLKDAVFMEASLESLSMLDGRISMVAFGTTPSQPSRFNLNGGKITAQNNTGNRLVIADTGSGIIFNDSLGLVEYEVGDQKIGYENGGLFRKYAEGDTVMISPPEFYYTEGTLTFPILKINSSASMGGKGIITINTVSKGRPVIRYPNITSNANYTNPITNKHITIRLQSEYYKVWAKYIEERTEVVPLTNDITQEVVVSLNSKPSDEPSPLVMPIEVMGLDTTNSTPLNQFMFNLSNVNNSFDMVIRAPNQTSDDFVIRMNKTSSLFIWVNYTKNGYNEIWKADLLDPISGNITYANLLNSSVLAYYNTSNPSGTWLNESSPYNTTYNNTNKGPVNLSVVMQHYIKMVSDTGTFALYKGTNSGDPPAWPTGFNLTNSTYILDYNTMTPSINYLYIVEHDVNIDFH
jgi:hypothetical protein